MNAAEEADIHAAWKDGASYEDLATDFGTSTDTIAKICRKLERAEKRKREKPVENILAGDDTCSFRSVGINEFEGLYKNLDGTWEKQRFDGLRSQAEFEWEAWRDKLKEKDEWAHAIERVAPEPPKPKKAPTLYLLEMGGRPIALFRDSARAETIAQTLSTPLVLDYVVSPITFWEGE